MSHLTEAEIESLCRLIRKEVAREGVAKAEVARLRSLQSKLNSMLADAQV